MGLVGVLGVWFFFSVRLMVWGRGWRSGGGLTEWAQCCGWEAREVDVEDYARAVRGGGAGHGAADAGRVAVGERGGVGDADGVVLHDGCIAEFTGCAGDDGAVDGGDLGVGEEGEGEDGKDG